jgi:hypothetical protein
MSDLDELDMGMVFDKFIEHSNESADYPIIATQADMDRL